MINLTTRNVLHIMYYIFDYKKCITYHTYDKFDYNTCITYYIIIYIYIYVCIYDKFDYKKCITYYI